MPKSRFSLRERVAPVVITCCLAALPAAGQRTSSGGATGGATSTGSSTGTTGSIGRGTGNIPSNTYPNTTNSPSTMQRPVFLSGKIMFDDGSQPNMDVRIERVCSGIPHVEGHTDTKGRFSFQVGQNQGIDMDASDPSAGGIFGRSGGTSPMGSTSSAGNIGSRSGTGGSSALWGCELRASYPGYRSTWSNLGRGTRWTTPRSARSFFIGLRTCKERRSA